MAKKSEVVLNKFGTKEYFKTFMENAIKEEGKTQEVIQRIHFAMTHMILETHKGKEALVMVMNLTEAGEELSQWKKTVSYIE